MTNGVAAPNVPPGTEAVHKGERMIRAAILDDYQNVAMSLADWSPIAKDVEIKVFNEPFANQAEAVKALQGFAVVVGMRERTPFPRAVIEALPDLKLLITTGAKNNSFDVKAATERGVTVCGTGGFGNPTTAIAVGLMLELTRRIGFENARMKAGEAWQVTVGQDLEGQTLGVLGLGKLGFVAAKPIPQVLRNINAFTLGARLANPKATTQVIFTGDWSMPVKEAEATNSLIDQGVDVLTCHVDGPKTMVENAARRGAMVCGYHVNQSPLAPKAYLTGAEWNWEVLYPRFVKMFTSGATIPNFYRGGLKEELVKVSPYGAMVSEAARKQADDVKAQLVAGTYTIFKGPIADNKGKAVIASGVARGQTDTELEKMDYLVEGVIGATS